MGWLIQLPPLRRFMLAALLWLPLAFVIWFRCASVLVRVPIWIANAILSNQWPGIFDNVEQQGFLMQTATHLLVSQTTADGRAGVGELVLTANPMAYGYALPLFAGLVLATPLTRVRRMWQLLMGIALIWLAQGFGLVAETLKQIGFDTGAQGMQVAKQAGLSLEWIALCYQFGYLILPALLPAVLWIMLNRAFIEDLTLHDLAEPVPVDRVESQHASNE